LSPPERCELGIFGGLEQFAFGGGLWWGTLQDFKLGPQIHKSINAHNLLREEAKKYILRNTLIPE
jgi:hypothetical protein